MYDMPTGLLPLDISLATSPRARDTTCRMSSVAVVLRHVVPGARVFKATPPASTTARGVRHPASSGLTSPSRYHRHAHQRVRSPTHHRVPRASGDTCVDGREVKPAVAVVKTSACPHCRRAEAALREAGIAFVEVDASDAAGVVRDAATAVSGMRTVPQVFVGGACMGGADDTIAAIESGELAERVRCALADARDATPPLLAAAAAAAAAAAGDCAVDVTKDVAAASGSGFGADAAYDILDDAAERMSRDLTPGDRWTFGGWRCPIKLERRVVAGADVAKWIARDERTMRAFADSGTGEEGAASVASVASRMCELGLLSSADGSRALDARVVRDEDGAGSIPFRLADHAAAPSAFPDAKPLAALNARRRFRGPARDARSIAADLRARILRLHDAFLSPDGAFLDYEAMRDSDAFREYARAAEALQTVSLCSLTEAEKTAFFVNLYNALVVHVTVAAGTPKAGLVGFFDRLSYFDRHSYEVGGVTYTCDDIEHGCLRGNRPGAASLGALLGNPKLSRGPFAATDDPRRKNAIVHPDPRVHFALVCGAKSCPPIRLYDGDNLESQLAAAAAAFVESETRVAFGDARQGGAGDETETENGNRTPSAVVTTSKIVGSWYKWDFGENDAARVAALATYAGRETLLGRELARAAETPGVVVATRDYDWDLNGKA